MHKANSVIEIHHSIDVFPDGEMGKKAKNFMQNAFEEVRSLKYNEYEFGSLSVPRQAVGLLMHMIRHFNQYGIGLKQLLDWVLFVEKNREIYEEEVKPFLDDFGLSSFAFLMYSCGITYIKNNEYDTVSYESSLRQSIIEIIMRGGNFGHAAELSIKYGSLFHARIGKSFTWKDVYNKQLIRVQREHQLVAKTPFLTPVFVVFRSLRSYIRMRINGGVKLHALKRNAEKHNKLFLSFKLFE